MDFAKRIKFFFLMMCSCSHALEHLRNPTTSFTEFLRLQPLLLPPALVGWRNLRNVTTSVEKVLDNQNHAPFNSHAEWARRISEMLQSMTTTAHHQKKNLDS